MNLAVPTYWLAYAGGSLLVAGSSIAFGMSLRPQGALGKTIARYIARLDGECRFHCWAMDGRQFFIRQVGALVLSIIACVAYGDALLWVLPPLTVFGPHFALRFLRKKRVERLEAQLDGWLLILSNMLKTTGGLGDALAGSSELVRAPLRQELDQVLKEVRLGATLEDALRLLGERVKSTTLAAVITLLLIGRRTGGELPVLLETASASLREMARLEGVIRTKTAAARTQSIILGVAPAVLFIGFRVMEPTYFDPLFKSLLGYVVVGVAIVLWVGAIYTARKILNVDY